jgi:uncharacterized SAM-binding protein YcdF (DUF218 family)
MVVLGCRLSGSKPGGALLRRLLQAEGMHRDLGELPIIFSGGRQWNATAEADAMESWWRQRGNICARVTKELRSQTTAGNAKFCADLCREFHYHRVLLVTCDFHMARATRHFAACGLVVIPCSATMNRPPLQRLRLSIREWAAGLFDRLGLTRS